MSNNPNMQAHVWDEILYNFRSDEATLSQEMHYSTI